MPKIPPEGMSQVIPYLYYADVPKAVDWLVKTSASRRSWFSPPVRAAITARCDTARAW